jgi:hypothetical protein
MIVIPAIVESIKSRKDRSTAIVIGTNELSPSVAGQIFSLQNSAVYCALKLESFNREEEEILDGLKADVELTKKSPGQRLRNILYKNYEHESEGFKSFNSYYEHKMEIILNHYKSKLL